MSWTEADVIAHHKEHGFPPPQFEQQERQAKAHKYSAKAKTVFGVTFPSSWEAKCFETLVLMLNAGELKQIATQVEYELQPAFRHPETGRLVRAIRYVADFFVLAHDGYACVIESKGLELPAWRLKEKLFRAKWPNLPLVVWTRKAGNLGDLGRGK